MSMSALWLSRQERVEVESLIDKTERYKYKDPEFRAIRHDGSSIVIDRRDILLDEEQTMIDELAQILNQSGNPAQHERYSVIMRHLIMKGVPYVKKLQTQVKTGQTQQLLLSDVS